MLYWDMYSNVSFVARPHLDGSSLGRDTDRRTGGLVENYAKRCNRVTITEFPFDTRECTIQEVVEIVIV